MFTTLNAAKFRHDHGFTLVEVLIVVSIFAILASIAVPNYLEMKYRAEVTAAIADIKSIATTLYGYSESTGDFPASLADVGLDGKKDPWGNPYEYWPIMGDKNQKVRKDRSTHPINTDFDLFSSGKDGDTNYALTAHSSQDDVIRANNGGFIGLASKY